MGFPWAAPEIHEAKEKKKEEVAKKMTEASKEYSPSGQRHDFDRKFKKTGKATRFGYKDKFKH